MKFEDIIKLHGFNPSKFRLARHGNKEINPLEAFRSNPDRFNAYQAFQSKDRLGDASYVASFAPYHGTQAILLKVYRIEGKCSHYEAPPQVRGLLRDVGDKFGWWATEEQLRTKTFYELTEVDQFNEYSERSVIEWGGSTVAWVQKQTSSL